MKTARSLGLALFVPVLVVIVFWNARPGAFHFDDFHSIINNPALAWVTTSQIFTYPQLFSAQSIPMYRPITILSFALQARAGALSSSDMIAVNIALHALSAALMFGVAFLLSRSRAGAFIAALLFALHPIQSQAVNYVACRASLLAGCLTLAAALLLLIAVRASGWARRGGLLLACLIFGLALLAKSEAFGAALVPLVLAVALRDERWKGRGLDLAAIGFILVAAGYLYLRWAMRVDVLVPTDPVRPIPANLATGARVIAAYLGLILWPDGLSVVHDLTPSPSLLDPAALGAAGFILSLIVIAALVRKRHPLVLAGMLWFLLGLAPTTTLVPLRNVMAEHHLYLAMAGLALAAAGIIGAGKSDEDLTRRHGDPETQRRTNTITSCEDRGEKIDNGPAALKNNRFFLLGVLASWRLGVKFWAAIAIIILCWSALTVSRNRAWRSETALWHEAAERAPESAVVWVNLGVSWYEDDEVMKARRAFERALVIDPERPEALTNLGRIYLDLGYREEAVGLLQLALNKAPAAAEVHYNLARAYTDLGQYRTAEYHYQQALALNPNYVTACENLAALYIYHLKQPDLARATLARCLAMNPEPEQLIRIQSLLTLAPP